MKRKLLCALLAALMLLAAGCSGGAKIVPIDTLSPAQTQANVYTPAPTQTAQVQADEPLVVARIEESGMSIGTRINPPMGYTRDYAAEGSFSAFLRKYPVRVAGADVMLYDGTARQDAQAAAVLDVTLGKKNQYGTLDEVLSLCAPYGERVVPCIDFAHLHAAGCGCINSEGDFDALLEEAERALGHARMERFHMHFSHIEYTGAGEKRHRTFAEEGYGPDFALLAPCLSSRGLCPTVICESAGTQAQDAGGGLLAAADEVFSQVGALAPQQVDQVAAVIHHQVGLELQRLNEMGLVLLRRGAVDTEGLHPHAGQSGGHVVLGGQGVGAGEPHLGAALGQHQTQIGGLGLQVDGHGHPQPGKGLLLLKTGLNPAECGHKIPYPLDLSAAGLGQGHISYHAHGICLLKVCFVGFSSLTYFSSRWKNVHRFFIYFTKKSG